MNNQGVDVLASINISSDIYGYKTLENILNLNLQLEAYFLGLLFSLLLQNLQVEDNKEKH